MVGQYGNKRSKQIESVNKIIQGLRRFDKLSFLSLFTAQFSNNDILAFVTEHHNQILTLTPDLNIVLDIVLDNVPFIYSFKRPWKLQRSVLRETFK